MSSLCQKRDLWQPPLPTAPTLKQGRRGNGDLGKMCSQGSDCGEDCALSQSGRHRRPCGKSPSGSKLGPAGALGHAQVSAGSGGVRSGRPRPAAPDKALGAETGGGGGALTGMGGRSWGRPHGDAGRTGGFPTGMRAGAGGVSTGTRAGLGASPRAGGRRRWAAGAEHSCRKTFSLPPGAPGHPHHRRPNVPPQGALPDEPRYMHTVPGLGTRFAHLPSPKPSGTSPCSRLAVLAAPGGAPSGSPTQPGLVGPFCLVSSPHAESTQMGARSPQPGGDGSCQGQASQCCSHQQVQPQASRRLGQGGGQRARGREER